MTEFDQWYGELPRQRRPVTKADLERAVNRMLIAQVAVAGLLFAALRLT